jgi:hypothetical protein
MFKINVYYVFKNFAWQDRSQTQDVWLRVCATFEWHHSTKTGEERHQSRAHVQMSNERTRFQQHRHHQVNIEMREHFGQRLLIHLIQKLFSLQGSNSIPEQDSSLLAAV